MGSDNYNNLATLSRDQAIDKWMWNEIGWNTSLWGPEPVIPDCTWQELEEWQKTECGCVNCWKTHCMCKTCWKNRYYNKFADPNDGQCFKIEARENELRKMVKERFQPSVNMTDFKPATKEQIEEWTSWLNSPNAKSACQRDLSEEETVKKQFENTKFDPIEMERSLMRTVPKKKRDMYVLMNPKWIAYKFYRNQQIKLANNYLSSLNISTMDDYNKAKKAYGTLSSHVSTHGLMIEEMFEQRHKAPVEKKTVVSKKKDKKDCDSSESE